MRYPPSSTTHGGPCRRAFDLDRLSLHRNNPVAGENVDTWDRSAVDRLGDAVEDDVVDFVIRVLSKYSVLRIRTRSRVEDALGVGIALLLQLDSRRCNLQIQLLLFV